MCFRQLSHRRQLRSDATFHLCKLLKTSQPPLHGKTRAASCKATNGILSPTEFVERLNKGGKMSVKGACYV